MEAKIAFIIPCYNEEAAIGKVVDDCRSALPESLIYVYDNNSIDKTAAVALAHGAIVRRELQRGKGNVVRRMFADVDADIYIMVDGDGTYDLQVLPVLLAKFRAEHLDMLVGIRSAVDDNSFRLGHSFGNKMFNWVVRNLFGHGLEDIFSGYRIFSRRFVKSFPVHSGAFEIETELSVHALEMKLPVAEVATAYGKRQEGSYSKLNTYKDGLKILLTIVALLKDLRPLLFFGSISAMIALIAAVLAYPLLNTYFSSKMVPQFPTWIGIVGMLVVSSLSLFAGIILDNIRRIRLDIKKLAYLRYPGS